MKGDSIDIGSFGPDLLKKSSVNLIHYHLHFPKTARLDGKNFSLLPPAAGLVPGHAPGCMNHS
jgi:hypothetical protein